VPVTAIRLDQETLAIQLGKTFNVTLTGMIEPPNATFCDILWSSDNPDVVRLMTQATTSSPGTVSLDPIRPGKAIIKATDAYGIIEKTCEVTVF
jgi:uncharacterized protein YjdB